jgi:aromatic-L-amino-acid/L-tryptophan decarboxylase
VTPDEFRRHGHDMVDWIADFLDDTGSGRRVFPEIQPGDVRARLPEHPPSELESFDDVVADLESIIVPGLTQWQHPGFFAWFPSNVSYPSILGELMSAGLGVNAMAWATSPSATELETLMLDWMQELLGLPARFRSTSEHGGGVIQGTASEATLVAMLAARWRVTGGDINADGDTTRLVGYCTSQAHSSIEKGFRIAGIGSERVRLVPHDERFAMQPGALAEMIATDRSAGLLPFFVCTTHGTTSSMAFDPTPAVAEICERERLWLHVDAAMSGIAALELSLRWVNDGLDRADSYTTNPHKWMGINFDCNLFWTADRASLIGALSILPPYLQSAAAEAGAAIDYRDWQIPLGRRFRALKLWFALRTEGVEPVQAMIRDHVAWTQQLADIFGADDRFEVLAPHPLNLLCVALRGDTVESANAATDALIDAANATGEVLFTRTLLDNRSALRISVGARATTHRDVLGAAALLQRLAPAR